MARMLGRPMPSARPARPAATRARADSRSARRAWRASEAGGVVVAEILADAGDSCTTARRACRAAPPDRRRDLEQPRRVHRAAAQHHLAPRPHLLRWAAALPGVADATARLPSNRMALARALVRTSILRRDKAGLGRRAPRSPGGRAGSRAGNSRRRPGRRCCSPRCAGSRAHAAGDEGLRDGLIQSMSVTGMPPSRPRASPPKPMRRSSGGNRAARRRSSSRGCPLRPIVEVVGLAAVVDHAVDRARSAEGAALRRGDARPPVLAVGSVLNCQVQDGSTRVLMKPAGMWIQGLRRAARLPARRP